jgi:hypothetical protein
MDWFQLLDLFLILVLTCWLARLIVGWLGLETQAHDTVKIASELEKGSLIPLTVEVAGNTYLCYNSINKEFVCQGSDLDEIVQHFRARYPDKSAAIYNGDAQAVEILRIQLDNKRVKL